LDALLISTFFSQTKNKTGVSLENKIRESDGGINVETSQVKFNIKTFVSLIIGIVSAVFSGGMWLSGFFHEQTAQKKEIEELKNTLNRSTQKVDSLVQLKTGTLDEVKDKLIEIDAKLNRSKK
jgi:Tfp pilus assembly protein PilO